MGISKDDMKQICDMMNWSIAQSIYTNISVKALRQFHQGERKWKIKYEVFSQTWENETHRHYSGYGDSIPEAINNYVRQLENKYKK